MANAPARAPWTVIRHAGIRRPAVWTLQGIVEDTGASNAQRFSVTNAVVLRVE